MLSKIDDWLGYVRFDFPRANILAGEEYFVTVISENYTRNKDDFYLGFVYDYPVYINADGKDQFFENPLALQFFAYEL